MPDPAPRPGRSGTAWCNQTMEAKRSISPPDRSGAAGALPSGDSTGVGPGSARGATRTASEVGHSDAAWWFSEMGRALREGSEYDTRVAARALVERTTADQELPLEVADAGVLSRVATIARAAAWPDDKPVRGPSRAEGRL